jgi:uncharacterized protein DUF6221
VTDIRELIEFLNDRIDDDEMVGQDNLREFDPEQLRPSEFTPGVIVIRPSRVIAEAAAKRGLIAIAERLDSDAKLECLANGAPMPEAVGDTRAREILHLLALPYAENPAFKQEWRS